VWALCGGSLESLSLMVSGMELGVGAVLPLLAVGSRLEELSVGVRGTSLSWWKAPGRKRVMLRMFPRLEERWEVEERWELEEPLGKVEMDEEEVEGAYWRVVQFTRR
jgi:hypothetical protein